MTTLTKALTALLLSLSLVACGGEDKSVDEQKMELIREEAPSWEAHTDAEVLGLMEQVCDTGGEMITQPPEGVSLTDLGYMNGLALATCDK